jgi:hypothetical protein
MVRILAIASLATFVLSAIAHSPSANQAVHHRRSSLARRNNNVNTNEAPAARAPKASANRKRGTKQARCATHSTTAGPSTSTDDSTDDSTDSSTTKKGSSTKTSSAAESTGSSASGGGDDPGAVGSSVTSASAVLPAAAKGGFTVSGHAVSDITKVTLTDSTFKSTKAIKNLPHPVVKDPQDGLPAIHAHFAKGAYDLKASPAGGFSFYATGVNGANVDLSNAKVVSFAYSVKFSKGYDFNMGGKLPGLYGGTDENVAATCSGGNHNENCFSTRFMFRDSGKGELYLYIPPSQNRDNLCGKTGTGKCRGASSNGKTYGASMGTGVWMFKDGEYTTVRQVVTLNTPGKRDGSVLVYVNGGSKPVFTVTDISFRSSAKSVFVGMQMQTFHGGHDPSWAPDHAQDSYFRDFSVAIIE